MDSQEVRSYDPFRNYSVLCFLFFSGALRLQSNKKMEHNILGKTNNQTYILVLLQAASAEQLGPSEPKVSRLTYACITSNNVYLSVVAETLSCQIDFHSSNLCVSINCFVLNDHRLRQYVFF